MKEFYIGASYYPEWWDESEWKKDFLKMKELGFNLVRMGEFAWSWFEPVEGNYNFEPMIKVLDIAKKYEINVIMGTTTAVCPAWLYKKYPEVKGGNILGHYHFGGRKGQCLSSEKFLEYGLKITEKQAEALGNHPAIIGWQLDNEPGFPFNDFDECCIQGFRKWLKCKYSSIEELNKAWFTMMWSNKYTSFDEIDIPLNSSEGGFTKEIQLDYRRYFSYTFNNLLSCEAKIIKKYSPGRFVYTNWPGANWSVNCKEAMNYLDFSAWDNYVGQPNGDNFKIQYRASMEHSFDRMLSNGKNEFIVAEQHSYTDANTFPQVISAQTMLNVSHGAFATCFFEWRTPLGGAEQGYRSLLRLDGSFDPDTYNIFKELSIKVRKCYSLTKNGITESDIAFIYSYENSWGTDGWKVDGFYDEEIFSAYSGFRNILQKDIDIVCIDDDLSKYKIIVLLNFRITTAENLNKLENFVKNGGILILNTECGFRDINNKNYEMLLPGMFRNMCSSYTYNNISAESFKNQTGNDLKVIFKSKSVNVSNRCDIIVCEESKSFGKYSGGLLEGKDCASVNKYYNGEVILIGNQGCSIEYYEELAKKIYTNYNLERLQNADEGIIISSRRKNNITYYYCINMTDKEKCVYLNCKYYDVISESIMQGTVKIKPYDTLMIYRM